ncbi:MAG: TonB-dependent receptor [Deltaproteobacteria bacterium]
MIERSGVRNLRDALVTFVPGCTNAQDHNELNVAVRGVYASSQQKIGNVALGVVVNFITRDAKKLDGTEVTLGFGARSSSAGRSTERRSTTARSRFRPAASVNLFYSYFTDFIFRNNAAAADEPIYQNAGHLAAAGVENEVSYAASMFKALVNATYQRAVDAENYGTTGGAIHAVPSLTGNAVLDFNPLWTIGQELWLNLTLYFQGGSVQHPYPQSGRWWQLSATARF